jgi:hypothetical protein
MSGAQRALWTFLMYTLVGPFFAAIVIAAVLVLAPLLGLGALLPENMPPLGAAAITTFVWAVIPAVLVALALSPIALRQENVGWILAAIAGAVAFAISATLFPIGMEGARPYLTFLAGLIALAVREVLVRAGVLTA